MQTSYKLRGRVWIEGNEGTFLGYGRAVLLERIRDHGSISAAARSMKMSYRHAWKLVDSMNRQGKTALVATSTGGSKGGGAQLTDAGHRAIACFWQAHGNHKKFLHEQSERLAGLDGE